ncbi:MAG: DNA polymerase, partial [Thermoplasmata archaeon]
MPTALELTREQWAPYLAAARRRTAGGSKEAERTAVRELLLARVREAANALKAKLGVKRVILFGSLARPDCFVADSDVDLAVAGLEDGDFFAAWEMVEDIISDRLVDLIEIESASESLRRAIERNGLEL